MSGTADNDDLGGDRACWLDEVCPSCGGIGGHRAGCDAVQGAAEAGSDGSAEADQEVEPGIVPPYLLRRVRGTEPGRTGTDPDARD